MSDRLLYDMAGAGEQLSVSARKVETLIAEGEIVSVKVGRRRLVPHDALTDYIDRLKAQS